MNSIAEVLSGMAYALKDVFGNGESECDEHVT